MTAHATALERGGEDVRAAQALLEAGFPSQALSCACSAALGAARAVLLASGETPSTDAGVVAAFTRHTIGDDRREAGLARALRKLFEDRNDVEQALATAPGDEAQDAIEAARRILGAATRELEP
jgi:uncharacterized protein (UPF0332 family)